jgi:hypothetical protein
MYVCMCVCVCRVNYSGFSNQTHHRKLMCARVQNRRENEKKIFQSRDIGLNTPKHDFSSKSYISGTTLCRKMTNSSKQPYSIQLQIFRWKFFWRMSGLVTISKKPQNRVSIFSVFRAQLFSCIFKNSKKLAVHCHIP